MNYVQTAFQVLKDELVAVDACMNDCDDLIELYELLMFTKKLDTNLKDVHDAWAIWRNRTKPDHKSLKEFEDLSAEVQELDRKYLDAIHRAYIKYNK